MKWLKYLFSIICLGGATILLLTGMERYQAQGFSNEHESGIRTLERVKQKMIYSAEDIGEMLMDGEYQYIGDEKNQLSDQVNRENCIEVINRIMVNIPESDIKQYLVQLMEKSQIYSVERYKYNGYIDITPVLFCMVHVWFEDLLVIYEEQTGLIQYMEYYVPCTNAEEMRTLEENRLLVEDALHILYKELGLENCISSHVFGANGDKMVVVFELTDGKEHEIGEVMN